MDGTDFNIDGSFIHQNSCLHQIIGFGTLHLRLHGQDPLFELFGLYNIGP